MSTIPIARSASTVTFFALLLGFAVFLSGCTVSEEPSEQVRQPQEKHITSSGEITDVLYGVTLDCPEGWICKQKDQNFGAHLNAPDALVNVFVANAFRAQATPEETHAAEVQARSVSTVYYERSVVETGEMNGGHYSVIQGKQPETNHIRETTFVYNKKLGEKDMACIGNVSGEPFETYEAEIRFACGSMRPANQ